jgi:hypothetical protein
MGLIARVLFIDRHPSSILFRTAIVSLRRIILSIMRLPNHLKKVIRNDSNIKIVCKVRSNGKKINLQILLHRHFLFYLFVVDFFVD